MKKLTAIALSAILALSLVVVNIIAEEYRPITIKLNGNTIDFGVTNGQQVEAVTIYDYAYVPISKIIEILTGTAPSWNDETKTASFEYNGKKYDIDTNKAGISVDGEFIDSPTGTPPVIVNSRTLIPLRMLSEALGIGAEYKASEHTTYLTTDGSANVATPPADSGGTINLYLFTNEVSAMVKYYIANHPDWAYTVKETIIPTDGGSYQVALDQALMAGGSSAPDIYSAEEYFVTKYTSGTASRFAANYKDLGIDVDAKIREAQIAPYISEVGTRNGQIVALTYQSTGGAFIYRRSIAKDVFGTDDPAVIKNEIGPGWDKFFAAADKLKAKGYSTLSGTYDLWVVISQVREIPYVQNDKFVLDSARESFLDYAKLLKDKDYTNQSAGWSDNWVKDMGGLGARQVFGYFGPAWFLNYVMPSDIYGNNGGAGKTFGDWAICEPPVGFFWGGTWLLANKDTKVAGGVKDLIEWITLDTSETGLQYLWANGMIEDISGGVKDTVASEAVMAKSDGELDILGGQNMFDVFIPAANLASGNNLSEYDDAINTIVEEEANLYADGLITRDEALANIKKRVSDKLGINS